MSSYQYITRYTSPNQNARNQPIAGITIHWWGTPSGQAIEGVVSWLCSKQSGTSAHYVITDGTVYCIVAPKRRAWHAGDSQANHHQIGLELDPNPSKRAGTMRTAAALIADLRKQFGDLPLSPHRRWTSTQCPGDYDLSELDRLARGAKALAAKPAAAAPPFPLPRTAKARYVYGPASGPITYVSGRGRNSAVPNDVRQDSSGRWYSVGLKQWQARMRERGWTITADGRFGDQTQRVVVQFQESKGLLIDGLIGPDTWAAAWTEPVT